MSEIKVANLTVKPGSKAKGFVTVAETSTFDIKLPLHIVNGSSPGPTYAIIAGIHPVEYPPMEGTIRLANELDPKKMKGTLITVPVFNTPGFQARVPGAPLERTQLTSAFPGNPEGGMNDRIAHFITNEIIEKSDYVMEAHGCNFQETCPKHIIMQRTGNQELDKKTLEYARCFDGKYVRRAMEHHISPMREKGYSVMTQALKMNKPCILPEVGSNGGISSETGQINEEDVKWFMAGVKNFMRKIGMLEGKSTLYDPWAVKEVSHFRSKTAGWYYPMKENGETFSKGEVIGEVRDFFGEIKEQIIAPTDGVVSLIWTRPAVDQGSILIQMFELGPKTSTLF
ncbi:succinylglutamate desuccinylase/aspartoacylase family protein [Thermoproteota archaeon]